MYHIHVIICHSWTVSCLNFLRKRVIIAVLVHFRQCYDDNSFQFFLIAWGTLPSSITNRDLQKMYIWQYDIPDCCMLVPSHSWSRCLWTSSCPDSWSHWCRGSIACPLATGHPKKAAIVALSFHMTHDPLRWSAYRQFVCLEVCRSAFSACLWFSCSREF